MFGFLAPLLGKLGGSAIAGTLVQTGLGALQARSERKAAQRDQANQFVQLKDAALRAGFNPLTALQSTGGSGFGGLPSGIPPLASVQALAGAITDATARNSDGSATRQGVGGLRKIAADNLNAATAGGRVSLAGRAAEAMPMAVRPASGAASPPPPARYNDPQSFIWVRSPTGQLVELDASIARRLDIEPYETMMIGDYEETFGEIGGEIASGIGTVTGDLFSTVHNRAPVHDAVSGFMNSVAPSRVVPPRIGQNLDLRYLDPADRDSAWQRFRARPLTSW